MLAANILIGVTTVLSMILIAICILVLQWYAVVVGQLLMIAFIVILMLVQIIKPKMMFTTVTISNLFVQTVGYFVGIVYHEKDFAFGLVVNLVMWIPQITIMIAMVSRIQRPAQPVGGGAEPEPV